MPKTRLQECAFTVLMTFVMVYAMICFNIAITQGIKHMITMGKATMSRGRKALRRICKNSFWMR